MYQTDKGSVMIVALAMIPLSAACAMSIDAGLISIAVVSAFALGFLACYVAAAFLSGAIKLPNPPRKRINHKPVFDNPNIVWNGGFIRGR